MKKESISFFLCALLPAALVLPACKKSGGEIVARVGSVKISKADFERELLNSPPAYQNYLATVEGKKQFLDILLRERILLAEAEHSGIAKKKEVQKNLKEFRDQMKEQEAEFRKNVILRDYLRDLQDGQLKVTEAEIRAHYDANKTEYLNPVKIKASHILSPSQEKAEAVLARLKKGEDFGKVARELSTDPSAARGGQIGEVVRGDLSELPEFEAALFSLKTGQTSAIVKSKLGYHVIRKEGETRLPKQLFEEAAPAIRRLLEKRKFDDWIEKIKKEKHYSVNEALLATVSRAPEKAATELQRGSAASSRGDEKAAPESTPPAAAPAKPN